MPTSVPTSVPHVSTSVSHTTHHVPAPPNAEIRNIYNIKNNIKIIINNAENSKNVIDKHILNMLHRLDLSRHDDNELYKIVEQTHTHLHTHYNNIVDYYKKMMEGMNESMDYGDDDERSDRYEKGEKGDKGEKGEKGETKEENEIRLKKSSNLIESMIKLNRYIKMIEYKIHFIKGETKYSLLRILFSLRKKYQDDMIQMLKYL